MISSLCEPPLAFLLSMLPPLSDDLNERIVKLYYEDQDTMAEIAGQAVAPLDQCPRSFNTIGN